MLNRDIKIMEFLRRCAIDNPGVKDKFKLAACVVYKRDIISVGINALKSHPMQKQYGKCEEAIYLHAEVRAISNALNHINKVELSKSDLFIYRVKHPHEFSSEWVDGMAKPCEGCIGCIGAFDIGRVVYSTDNDRSFEELRF